MIAVVLTSLWAGLALADSAAPAAPSAAEQIHSGRVELLDKLPVAIGSLPLSIGDDPSGAQHAAEAENKACVDSYAADLRAISDLLPVVSAPMRHRAELADAQGRFDTAYGCALRMAYLSNRSGFANSGGERGFQSAMSERMAVVKTMLGQSRLTAQQAQQKLADIQREVAALPVGKSPQDAGLPVTASARRFAGALLARDFKLSPSSKGLDSGFVPAAGPGMAVAAPGISARIVESIQKWSDKLNFNSVLAVATCLRESGCRQKWSNGSLVTSDAGATGVMQIMPGTARGLAAQLRLSSETILNNADANIHAGIYYLQTRLNAYGADTSRLTSQMAAFVSRVSSLYSRADIEAADRNLGGGHRRLALPVVEAVVNAGFDVGLGGVIKALASYNGERNPNSDYSRWNHQSHDYVFYILENVLRMMPAQYPGADGLLRTQLVPAGTAGAAHS